MEASGDRRNIQRQGCSCEVTWCHFNKECRGDAHLLNFSAAGTYFETARPVTPGTTVLIRVLSCTTDASEYPKDLRFNAIGEVKWCRELSSNGETTYGIGVKYHFPV